MNLYRVTGNVVLMTKRGVMSRQLPAFLLDGDIQGIMTPEQGCKVAIDVLTTLPIASVEKIAITCWRMDNTDSHFMSVGQQELADLLERRTI